MRRVGLKRCLLAALALGLGCDGIFHYDPPAEVVLVQPEGGVLREGDLIILSFSEPVLPETLVLRIWSAEHLTSHDLVVNAFIRNGTSSIKFTFQNLNFNGYSQED